MATDTHSQMRPKNRREREPEADDQHGDEHAEPHDHVEPLVGQGQHVGAQEQAPRDPEGDPGQEGEADVAEVVTETVGAIRRLEARVAEPQPQPLQAKPPPGSLALRRRCLDLVHLPLPMPRLDDGRSATAP